MRGRRWTVRTRAAVLALDPARVGPRAVLRLVLALALAAGLLVTSWVAAPRDVFACRCAPLDGFERFADAGHIVVTGTTLERAGERVTIGVERWFWGGVPQAILVVQQPDDRCAPVPGPRIGSRWLWVATIPDAGVPVIGGCLGSQPLDAPDGRRALALVERAFDGGVAIDAPIAPEQPAATPAGIDPVLIGSGIAAALGGLAIFGSVAAFARRRADR